MKNFQHTAHFIQAAQKIAFFIFSVGILCPGKTVAQYNLIDWASYFSDTTTGFTYADDELIDDIKIDNRNPENIYVVGRTRSSIGTNTPCPGNTLTYGKGDVAIAKYNRCGELIWSRYLGNKKKTDYGYTLALDYDTFGNPMVYIAGEMKTTNFLPLAFTCDGGATPFRSKPVGSWDGFIARYDEDGNLQRWTYFGGKDSITEKVDQVLGMAIANHHVFITGYTESPDLHRGSIHSDDTTFEGAGDGFLAEFSSDLHSLDYFTYIGGAGKDRCHGIKIYQLGNQPIDVFVDGTTPSASGIFAGAGFDNTLGGDLDGFVGKWEDDDGDGKFTKTWCTYIGGNGTERARDMDVDDLGNIMLVGQTNTPSLPWAKGYDSTYNGGNDAFVIKIPNGGGSPLWGTYFGGYANEETVGLIWKKGATENHVIISGITYSSQKTTCLPVPNPNNYTVFPLQKPIIKFINAKKGDTYCPGTVGDSYLAEFTDQPVGQTLVFSTYLGGSGNEVNGENQLSYNPSLAILPSGELYIALNTKSSDIKKSLGTKLGKLYGNYSGGIDGFVARLIDSTSMQFNCPLLRTAGDEMDEAATIAVYPNPSADVFQVKMNVMEESSVTLTVYDNMGRVVRQQEQQLTAGSNHFSIDLRNKPSGFYLLRATYEDHTSQVKLLKQ